MDGNVTYIPPASLGGISVAEEEKVAFLRGERTYEEPWAPGSNDPRERLAVMDDQGIDISVLYPTIGICWEGWVDDAELATAYTTRLQPLDCRLLPSEQRLIERSSTPELA